MEDKPYLTGERIGELPPGTREGTSVYPARKRGKISLYILVTVSVAVFALAFGVADGGRAMLRGEMSVPAGWLASPFDTSDGKESLTLSEWCVARVLGVPLTQRNTSVPVSEGGDDVDGRTSETDVGRLPEDAPDTVLATDTSGSEPETDTAPEYAVERLDLSQSSQGLTYIVNETSYQPDTKALLTRESRIAPYEGKGGDKDPIVLILHTHGTEAYLPEGTDSYRDDGSDISRSTDTEENVVAVGRVIARVLNEAGVPTLHCETMHDADSYQESYARAAATIRDYLVAYPTIQYVFDVHRDAILKADGTLVGAAVEVDGESTAQVMTVVGSNDKGANFPDWEDHLSLALKFRRALHQQAPGIDRPVYLRGAAYNEQYTPGSLLLEIGSSGNTLAEAKRAAAYTATALAELIKGET